MRKSKIFIVLTCVEILIVSALYLFSSGAFPSGNRRVSEAKRELVRALALTDYAIWTEARYTRHPSQADFFSAFQDAPSSFEHFPAGSVIAPAIRLHDGP